MSATVSLASLPREPEAERSVLGGILLMPERLWEVADVIGPDDFAAVGHRAVFAAMLDLAASGDPIDVITVADELRKVGKLEDAGGLAGVAALDAAVPASANLVRYAELIKDASVRRGLAEASSRIRQAACDPETETGAALDLAQRLVFEAGDRRQVGRGERLKDVVLRVFNAIEQSYERQSEVTGLHTGLVDFDRMTAGLQKKDLIIIAARPSMGKAQPLDAKVLTPSGFVRMGDLRVGSLVVGADGRPTRVVGVFPQGRKPVFRVTMSDGASTLCCDEHLWWTQTRTERKRGSPGSVKPLAEIRRTITRPDSDTAPNHAIPLVGPVWFVGPQGRPLDPYLLGALLGDGGFTGGRTDVNKPERDVQQRVVNALPAGDAASVNGMCVTIRREVRSGMTSETREALRSLGLAGLHSHEKFIPDAYLYGPVADRRELLRGLLDTDGYVTQPGLVEYSTSSPRLCRDVTFLARSLGGIVTKTERDPTYVYRGEKRTGRRAYRLRIKFPGSDLVPVSSRKHLARRKTPSRQGHRSIVSVEPAGDAECQCIAVASPDHLYVTDDFIVTHNTALVMNIAAHVAIEQKQPVAVFSLEMGADALTHRMLASEGRVDAQRLRNGRLLDSDWPKLARAADRMSNAPIEIDDTSAATVMHIRSRCRHIQAQHKGLGLVVVDYLQLMGGKGENREQQIAAASRGLKALAKDLDCPVIALSQLNRGLESRSDKRPMMSDLRESGAIEQDADVIGFIYRDEYYDKQSQDRGVAELIIGKQRNGPTGTVRLRFESEYTRFDNLAREER